MTLCYTLAFVYVLLGGVGHLKPGTQIDYRLFAVAKFLVISESRSTRKKIVGILCIIR